MTANEEWGELPEHVHIEYQYVDHRADNHSPASAVVLWADRPYSQCPECGQEIQRTGPCPLLLNDSDGEMESRSLRHADLGGPCAYWLSTPAGHLDAGTATPKQVHDLARELAEDWEKAVERSRQKTRKDLKRKIQFLAPGFDETEEEFRERMTNASLIEPGPYGDPDKKCWAAWDYDPGDDTGEDIITIPRSSTIG